MAAYAKWYQDAWGARELRLFTPYNQEFVAALKDTVIAAHRQWIGAEKCWAIQPEAADKAIRITGEFFPDLQVLDAPERDEEVEALRTENESLKITAMQLRSEAGRFRELHQELAIAEREVTRLTNDLAKLKQYLDQAHQELEEANRAKRFFQNLAEMERLRANANHHSFSHSSGPWAILHLANDAPPELVEAAYRALVKLHHPDRGGNADRMKAINAAMDQLRKELT